MFQMVDGYVVTHFDFFSASRVSQLNRRQIFCADSILREIGRLYEREAPLVNNTNYRDEQLVRRPHQHYLIHGPRGSGKTFMLLTLLSWLDQIPAELYKILSDHDQKDEAKATKRKQDLASLLDKHYKQPVVLKCIFPADSEQAGTVMDGIFAQIDQKLKLRLSATCMSEEDRRTVEDLRKRLISEIAMPWTFDRNLGGEALLNDSANFADYAKQRAEKAWAGVHRITQWREYVDRFLNSMGAIQLIIGIDDTDVRPKLTSDTLESLRLYLDHPRIVTIIAGNLSSMRKAMVVTSFIELGQAINTVGYNSPTAKFWRRAQRKEIEQYLEKVLPSTQRFQIGSFSERVDLTRLDQDFASFARSLGYVGEITSFDQFCKIHLRNLRENYFKAKFRAEKQYIEIGHDLAGLSGSLTTEDYRALESYVSWWQLRHHYATALRPTDARHLKSFLHYFAPQETTHKRLLVFLFECANNTRLLHEMHDHETHVLEWLRRQEVSSNWIGQRSISINSRSHSPGTYAFEVLCFRIDVAMSMPLRFSMDSKVPRSLLPVAWGEDTLPAHKDMLDWRQSTYIVGAVINHASIPRNCRFMSDLRVLPDVCFEKPKYKKTETFKIALKQIRHLFDLNPETDLALENIQPKCEKFKATEKMRSDPWCFLNDIRRAWAATLILDYGLHNEMETGSRFGDSDLRASRPPSDRSLARYKFLSLSELKEATESALKLGLEPSFDPRNEDEPSISVMRQARHLLLYLCALSDTLPSLILLDTSSKVEWQTWIESALAFLTRFASVLHSVHSKAVSVAGFNTKDFSWEFEIPEMLEAKKLMFVEIDIKEKQPMACTPDASFVTLFGTPLVGTPLVGTPEKSLNQSISKGPKVGGILMDAHNNLMTAFKFCFPEIVDNMQKTQGSEKSDAT